MIFSEALNLKKIFKKIIVNRHTNNKKKIKDKGIPFRVFGVPHHPIIKEQSKKVHSICLPLLPLISGKISDPVFLCAFCSVYGEANPKTMETYMFIILPSKCTACPTILCEFQSLTTSDSLGVST